MKDYILNWNQKKILKQIVFLKKYDFYLAGGTALALQLGHRRSVDIYFLIKKYDLNQILKFIQKKYSETFNEQNYLYALLYFKDAEVLQKDRKRMYIYKNIEWRNIKKYIEEEVKKYQLNLINK